MYGLDGLQKIFRRLQIISSITDYFVNYRLFCRLQIISSITDYFVNYRLSVSSGALQIISSIYYRFGFRRLQILHGFRDYRFWFRFYSGFASLNYSLIPSVAVFAPLPWRKIRIIDKERTDRLLESVYAKYSFSGKRFRDSATWILERYGCHGNFKTFSTLIMLQVNKSLSIRFTIYLTKDIYLQSK